jgi:hypothetical protein
MLIAGWAARGVDAAGFAQRHARADIQDDPGHLRALAETRVQFLDRGVEPRARLPVLDVGAHQPAGEVVRLFAYQLVGNCPAVVPLVGQVDHEIVPPQQRAHVARIVASVYALPKPRRPARITRRVPA